MGIQTRWLRRRDHPWRPACRCGDRIGIPPHLRGQTQKVSSSLRCGSHCTPPRSAAGKPARNKVYPGMAGWRRSDRFQHRPILRNGSWSNRNSCLQNARSCDSRYSQYPGACRTAANCPWHAPRAVPGRIRSPQGCGHPDQQGRPLPQLGQVRGKP